MAEMPQFDAGKVLSISFFVQMIPNPFNKWMHSLYESQLNELNEEPRLD